MQKTILKIGGILLILGAGYFVWPMFLNQPSRVACTMEAKLCPDGSSVGRTGPNCEFTACPGYVSQLEYKNSEYGFSVALPDSWEGYTVSSSTWTGYDVSGQSAGVPSVTGPFISIHNPQWTGPNTYQDIPIMVFTLEQWNNIQQEKLSVGAAPIPPSELGRNAKYVFALPARYNFAFPPGYEEVDRIIQGKPLTAF